MVGGKAETVHQKWFLKQSTISLPPHLKIIKDDSFQQSNNNVLLTQLCKLKL